MPLDTKTVDLRSEVERLTAEMESYAEQQAEAPVDSDGAAQAAFFGQQAERHRSGVRFAIETWDVDALTFAALTNGERHRVEDTVGDTGWKRQDCYVAAGTVDAPYLAHDPDAVEQAAFEETCLNVVDLHPAFVDWAESTIADLGEVGGETGKSYRTLVLEKRTGGTSASESG